MLILLFSFYLYYVYCDETKIAPTFNEAVLAAQVHQSLLKVDKFLKTVQQNIRSKKVVRLGNAFNRDGTQHQYPDENRYEQRNLLNQKSPLNFNYLDLLTTENDGFMDYSMTEMWWNATPIATSEITPRTSFLTTPPGHSKFKSTTEYEYLPETIRTTTRYPNDIPNPNYPLPKYTTFPADLLPGAPYPPVYNFTFAPPLKQDYFTPTRPEQRPPGPGKWIGPGPYPAPTGPGPRPYPGPGPYPTLETYRPTPEDVGPYEESSMPTPPTVEERRPLDPESVEVTTNIHLPPRENQEYEFKSMLPPDATLDPNTQESFITWHPNMTKHLQQYFGNKSGNYEIIDKNLPLSPPAGRTRPDPNAAVARVIPLFTTDPTTTLETAITMETPPPIRETTLTVGYFNVLKEDQYGVVYVDTTHPYFQEGRTTVMPDGMVGVVPPDLDMSWSAPTIAGDVLHRLPTVTTRDPYNEELHAEMDRELTGYMQVFLGKLFYLVAKKKPGDVKSVLQNVEGIFTKLFNEGRIAYWGQPLIHVAMNLAIALSESEIDIIQSYAATMRMMLKNRKKTAAVDINSIIDYYEDLYEEAEGELLFDSLKEFEEYPNITKSSYDLCLSLIDAFLSPMRRLYNSQRRQILLDSINIALISRFPDLPRSRRIDDASEEIKGLKPYSTKLSAGNNKINTLRNKAQYLKPNYLKHVDNVRPQIRSKNINKQNLDKEKYSEFNYERELRRSVYDPVPNINHRRRTLQSTRIQKRFNIITSALSRNLREKLTNKVGTRPTPSINLRTRPTTDYKLGQGNKKRINLRSYSKIPIKFFNQLKRISNKTKIQKYQLQTTLRPSTQDIDENLERDPDSKSEYSYTDTEYSYEKSKDKKDMKLKTGNLRKIVDVSSYSDEEDALRLNLISALIHGNRTFEMRFINETVTRPPMRAVSEETDEETESERKKQELSKSRASKTEILWRTGYDDNSSDKDRDSSIQNQIEANVSF